MLKEYLNRYKNSNVTGMDFKNLLEEKTGNDFDNFFEQWYFGEGYPIHSFTWSHHSDTLYITSLQSTSATTPLFNCLIDFRVRYNDKDSIIRMRQLTNFDHWEVYMPGQVTSVSVDPDQWLLMENAGINNLEQIGEINEFTLVPNPARDKITLRFSNPVEPYKVLVADSSGKILLAEKSQSQHKIFDIGNYPGGMYFVIVEIGTAHYPARFIKN
jgi:hypothetical protein